MISKEIRNLYFGRHKRLAKLTCLF